LTGAFLFEPLSPTLVFTDLLPGLAFGNRSDERVPSLFDVPAFLFNFGFP
jgi:hypothetical protein